MEVQYFEGQSAKSDYYHKVAMARLNSKLEVPTFIRGRSPYTYLKVDIDSFVTLDELSSTYVTRQELEEAGALLTWIDV